MVDAHHHAVRPESGMPLDLLVFLKLAAVMNSAGLLPYMCYNQRQHRAVLC
jgi:hypothetical protein